jgi:hypothetical protein
MTQPTNWRENLDLQASLLACFHGVLQALTLSEQAKISAAFVSFMSIEFQDSTKSLFDKIEPAEFKAFVRKFAVQSKYTAKWFDPSVKLEKQESLLEELTKLINPYTQLANSIEVSHPFLACVAV